MLLGKNFEKYTVGANTTTPRILLARQFDNITLKRILWKISKHLAYTIRIFMRNPLQHLTYRIIELDVPDHVLIAQGRWSCLRGSFCALAQ